jgi:phage recombination protein Bet
MSKELATLTNQELNEVLRNSLFPGASDMALELVKSYCHAAGLDIMMKPCHIVPMWNSKLGRSVDTIMPGIGSYRITAARTGQYAGISEPKYGPVVTNKIGGVECTYPEWCEITVKRNYGDFTAEFTSHELWIENYAEKGGKERSVAPNAMWMKRPFGQIKKCSEAQALRMAFPEVGSQPTADEMEGKETEIIINPLPSDKPVKSNFEATKDKINSLTLHQLAPDKLMSHIDISGLSDSEKATIKGLITSRRKEFKESTVVADIKPTTKPDWKQLLSDAQSDEEFNAIVASMTDEEVSSAINDATTKEQVSRLYMSLIKDRQEKFNDDVDFKNDLLGQ